MNGYIEKANFFCITWSLAFSVKLHQDGLAIYCRYFI